MGYLMGESILPALLHWCAVSILVIYDHKCLDFSYSPNRSASIVFKRLSMASSY